jgi:phospholipid/cholesterol/gamma-HCH transport system substrate-binding protein
MDLDRRQRRIAPEVWTLILLVALIVVMVMTAALFTGKLHSYVPVTVTAERSGLVMEPGAKVRMRGVQVGLVAGVDSHDPVRLRLDLFPDAVGYIPANVAAEIRATTAFGSKYVELITPNQPSTKHISAGAVVASRNEVTEVNTVFQSLVEVLDQVDPPKLNATLTALSEGVRGQGELIGEATSAANAVLHELNPRMDIVGDNWRAVRDFADAYAAAGDDIVAVLDASSTIADTIVGNADDLDALLLNVIGFSDSGITLIAPNQDNLVDAINKLQPTTALLRKYNPALTCTLVGAKWFLDNGGQEQVGGNGRSIVLDSAFNLGDDTYRYPDNLPLVAAKGGPGGAPGCGSLPDVTKQFPVRQLVTNTGWGTGTDWRPNPAVGQPWWVNFFPVTRAEPEPPSIRGGEPPVVGPDLAPTAGLPAPAGGEANP